MRRRRIDSLLLIAACWVPVFSWETGGYPEGPFQAANPIERGLRALAGNHPDSARDFFMHAHRFGMPKDSLYLLLAETALQSGACDTALVFNFSIAGIGSDDFRKKVLEQRLRIYARAGMATDAARVSDSFDPPSVSRGKKWEAYWNWASGYAMESHFPVHEYPFGENLGGRESKGWQAKSQAGYSRDLPGVLPLRLGFDGAVSKSYFKDSLDVDLSVSVRAGKLEAGPSLGLALGLGRVTGAGNMATGRADAVYLRSGRHGLYMIQAGYAGEWEAGETRRYDVFWFTAFADRNLPRGNLSFAVTTSVLRQDPLVQENAMTVMYVDDPSKASPVHFSNPSFRDTVIDSSAAATFAAYTAASGNRDVSMSASQRALTLVPMLSYSFPLPWGFSGEAGGRFEYLHYPDPYAWEVAEAPAPSEPGDFQGLALSQADRNLYGATVRLRNDTLFEFYSARPLETREEYRRDGRWSMHAALRRRVARWGTVGLEGFVGNNRTSLARNSPIWIASRESGLTLSWTSKW